MSGRRGRSPVQKRNCCLSTWTGHIHRTRASLASSLVTPSIAEAAFLEGCSWKGTRGGVGKCLQVRPETTSLIGFLSGDNDSPLKEATSLITWRQQLV